MPDSALDQAIREAYASEPEVIVHHTIEFRHPAFTEPIRVVRDHKSLSARLEEDAPENPGELVEFERFAFELKLPEVSDQRQPEVELQIDNVSREIVANIEAAVVTLQKIEFTYRAYVETNLDQPSNKPPLTLLVRHIVADAFKVTARIGLPDLTKAAHPRRTYSLAEFGSLA